jgi:hypothetical protein
MAGFNLNFCDPLLDEPTPLGTFPKEEVLGVFSKIDWPAFIDKRNKAGDEDEYYSPSFQVENSTSKAALEASASGQPDNYKFYIIYFTPQIKKKLLGITVSEEGGDLLTLEGQPHQATVEIIKALLNEDYAFLNSRFDAI